jgi:23S rRNA (adenine2503-C2)-methyltransferase
MSALPGKPGILRLSEAELAGWFAQIQQPRYRSRQVRGVLFRRGVVPFAQMTELPLSVRSKLEEAFSPAESLLVQTLQTADQTTKLLLQLHDGEAIEAVLMQEQDRRTICVSTQVGCAMGCVFCASGLKGVRRSLEAHEILEQFLWARRLLGPDQRLTHAVIMGMGEPLANLENLLKALHVVTSPQGLGLSRRRITISTVGLPQAIRRLADQNVRYHLAVSLHAPDNELRNELVPINRKIGIEELVEAADYFFHKTGRQVTYEYVLLRDVNDLPEHAEKLAQLLAGRKAHINLIPYNPVPGLPYRTPRSDAVHRFAEHLRRRGLVVHVRKTKGRKIEAACGQLRLRNLAEVPLGLEA